jgi:hypothetical protein
MVPVDKGWLDTVVTRFGETLAAVNRLNTHMGEIKLERRCTKARFETGSVPKVCPPPE